MLITAGGDVQKDRIVYEVVGWGRGKRSWSIDYGELPGDTADLDRGPWGQSTRCSRHVPARRRRRDADPDARDRQRLQHADRLQLGA